MELLDKEKILKGNKLIAEYMGGVSHEKETSFIKGYIGLDELNFQSEDYPEKIHDGSCWKFSELKYHQSIDWLIPVINKIKKSEQFAIISDNDDKWEVSIETTGYHYVTHTYQISESLVEACWLACIEYIEKFNNGTLKQSKK